MSKILSTDFKFRLKNLDWQSVLSYFRAFGQVVQADLEYNFETLIYRDSNGATSVIGRSLSPF